MSPVFRKVATKYVELVRLEERERERDHCLLDCGVVFVRKEEENSSSHSYFFIIFSLSLPVLLWTQGVEKNRESLELGKDSKMEKALTKVGSFWISKKAKEEISNITEDLSVCT